MRSAFAERYALWQTALAQCPGVQLPPSGGALYVFPKIQYRGMSGWEFCHFMLEEHHIAMVPGEIFGSAYADHVRISFGRDIQVQRAAATKLIEVLQTA